MGVNIGSNSIGSAFVGASEVSKMYLGNSLIYEAQQSSSFTVTVICVQAPGHMGGGVYAQEYDANDPDASTYINVDSTQDIIVTSGKIKLVNAYTDEQGPGSGVQSITGGLTYISGEYWRPIYAVTGDGTITFAADSCFARGTQITLADGTTKNVEDITYDDELLVWNLYEGKLDKAKPVWIMIPRIAMSYKEVTLSDGTILKLIGEGKKCHRLFNVSKQKFLYANECVGDEVYKQDGTIAKVIKCKIVKEWIDYYNLITDKHYNCFANGVLTGQMLNNTYRIEGMKYDTSERLISEQEEADKWASIKANQKER